MDIPLLVQMRRIFLTLAIYLILGSISSLLPAAQANTPGTFAATGSMELPRQNHTANLLPNGKVLIVGGYSVDGNYLATAEIFDPTTGTFTPTGSMLTARAHHTGTLLPNGQVLIAGGSAGGPGFATAELYDPETMTFSSTGSMGTTRYYHTGTLLDNGQVLVTGGTSGGSGNIASAELFDPATGIFTPTGSMVEARYSHTGTLLANGKVLVTGGSAMLSKGLSFGIVDLATAELFDPATGTFSPTGSMGTTRSSHTGTLLQNEKVLITGGWTLPTAELYDPASGTFTATGSMGTARSYHSGTLLTDGEVLIAGGFSSISIPTAELYDPGTGTFTATGSMGTAQYNHTGTLLPDGKVLIAGGFSSYSGALETTELYTPEQNITNVPVISSISPASGFVGTSVTISGANFGATTENSTVTFNNVPASVSSWSDTLIVTNVPAGATTGLVTVESSDGVGTSSNNFTVSLIPLPDLTLTALTAPVTGATGKTLNVVNTVKNIGPTGVVSPGFVIRFYLSTDATFDDGSDMLLGRRTVGSLAAKAISTATTTLLIPANTPAPGAYRIIAVADAANTVVELDETNNNRATGSDTAISLFRPDLELTTLTAPLTGTTGKTLNVLNTVKNIGPAGVVSPGFVIRFYLSTDATFDGSDVLLGRRTVGSLAAKAISAATTTLLIPANTPAPGTYRIIAVADAANTVVELDETNNIRATGSDTAVSLFRPDLTLTALTAPLTGATGKTLKVVNTVKNVGPAGVVSPGFVIRFYLSADATFDDGSDVLLGSRTVGSLAAKAISTATTTLLIPANTPAPGTYRIIAVADAANTVVELDETNNIRATGSDTAISLFRPDLTMTIVTTPLTGLTGKAFSVVNTVKNIGPATAGTFVVNLYLSTGNVIDAATDLLVGRRTVTSLAANAVSTATTSVTIPTFMGEGKYYFGAVIVAPSSVLELDGENNVMTQQIPITLSSSPLLFTVPAALPAATVGTPYSFSFCTGQPPLTSSLDLCGGPFRTTTNPTAGHPSYHFQKDSGAPFPPLGLSLNANGLFKGTPSVAGTFPVSVCAVDLDAKQVCRTTSIRVNNPTGTFIIANPDAVSMTASSCYPSQCPVSQTITITSSTPWTSSEPGFGSLGEGFSVSPNSGSAGSTPVTISYSPYAGIPAHADGFIRFRTTTLGVYVEVPVIVNVQ